MYKRKTFSAATIPTKCVKRKKRCLKWEVGRTLLSHLCPWWPTAAGPSSCKMLVLLHHWSNSARIQVVDPSKTNAGMGSFHSPAVTFHGGSLSKAAKTRSTDVECVGWNFVLPVSWRTFQCWACFSLLIPKGLLHLWFLTGFCFYNIQLLFL